MSVSAVAAVKIAINAIGCDSKGKEGRSVLPIGLYAPVLKWI